MTDVVPMNFWRLPVSQSVMDDLTEMENWMSTFPSYGASNGLSIAEDNKHVYIEAAVPGVDPEAIDVTFHKGVLWIKGEAKEEVEKKKYFRKAMSSFSYRVAIPEEVDPMKEPHAECLNGVMTVTFDKSEKTQPKKIAVKAVGNGKKTTLKK